MTRRLRALRFWLIGFTAIAAPVALAPAQASAQTCPPAAVTVQILGSGGPAPSRERASTSYLLWVGREAKALIDIGGGTYQRFGQSQAKLADLALVAITHLHPDHVSDLPALLWVSQQSRTAPLRIVGPSGNPAAGSGRNDVAPDFHTFLTRLFDPQTGAFPAMGGTLGGAGNGVRLEDTTIDVKGAEPARVFDGQGLTVTATGIPHANMPTLAYRIETGGVSIVFSSDQNGTDPRFLDFARNADLLIIHMQIAPGATSPLHAAPAVIGRIAREAGARRLLVSHIGPFDLDAAVADLKTQFTGPLTVGADLQCTTVKP